MLSCIMKFNEWVFENVKCEIKLSRFIVLKMNDYSIF